MHLQKLTHVGINWDFGLIVMNVMGDFIEVEIE